MSPEDYFLISKDLYLNLPKYTEVIGPRKYRSVPKYPNDQKNTGCQTEKTKYFN